MIAYGLSFVVPILIDQVVSVFDSRSAPASGIGRSSSSTW